MLYALRHPMLLLILIVAFAVGILARAFTQRLFFGRRRPAWARDIPHSGGSTSLLKQLDPYGTVAALLGGTGWGRPAEVTVARGGITSRQISGLLSGPIVQAALGMGCLIGFKIVRPGLSFSGLSTIGLLRGAQPIELLNGGVHTLPVPQLILLLGGVELLAMGILGILPIPPLDGGRLFFALAPQTGGWQRAGYRLEEENWGTAIIVLLMIIPLFNSGPLLGVLVGAIADPIVHAVGL